MTSSIAIQHADTDTRKIASKASRAQRILLQHGHIIGIAKAVALVEAIRCGQLGSNAEMLVFASLLYKTKQQERGTNLTFAEAIEAVQARDKVRAARH